MRDFTETDHRHMAIALRLAERAAERREVPVGAVLVAGDDVLGRGENAMIRRSDPTAHAEIVALRRAGARLGNYRLAGTTLYVTVEPCLMCAAAAVHARVERVVYGCRDPKIGSLASGQLARLPGLNHRFEVAGGLEEARSRTLLVEFFRERRQNRP